MRDAADAPLFGRDAELHQLRALAASAAGGQGAIVLLCGQGGIGKTRLVDHALAAAAEFGAVIRRARAQEFDVRRPFRPMATALGIDPGADDPEQRELARLLAGDGADRTEPRLVEAMVAAVEKLCAAGPVALAVDDLHWADGSTLRVLDRLGRAASHLPLLVCGAFRPAPRPPELARLLRAHALRRGVTLELQALQTADIKTLLSSLLDLAPGPRLVAQAAATGGNPFYVTRLVAALQATGDLTATATTAEVDAVDLPPDLRLTVLLELAHLSGDTQHMLRTASVLGSRFAVSDLALVLGSNPVALAPRLGEAIEARVLLDDGSALAFRHDLLREAIYSDVPLALRKPVHLHIAHTLAAAGATPLELAEHFIRGAAPGDAVALDWLQRAANQATVQAPTIAAELLERAAELFDPSDPGRDGLLADWAISVEALGRVREAEAMCTELLSRRQPPVNEAKLRLCLARMLYRRGRSEEAARHSALAEQIEGIGPALRARVLVTASQLPLLGLELDLDLAEDRARRGHEMAREVGDEVSLATADFTLAMVTFLRGRFLESVELAARARVTGDGAPDARVYRGGQTVHEYGRLVLGQAWLNLDRVAEGREATRTSRRAAIELGIEAFALHASAVIVVNEFMLGCWDDATTEFEALVDLSAEVEERSQFVVLAVAARALIALHRGQHEVAAAVLATSDDGGATTGYAPALARARLAESAGDTSAALETLVVAWDQAARSGVVSVLQHLAPDLVRLAREGADHERARQAWEPVAAMAAANPGAISLRGIELRCRGLRDDDPAVLVEAATVLRESCRPLDRARACQDAADALARAGEADDARHWFEEAFALYEDLGAAWDVSRVAARLRELGVRRASREARKRPKHGWESLTRSERAVVDLVAEGLSNPEVAERLYLSRHTVKRHLANATLKLGITSRRELMVRPRSVV
jgi:DNA-binding NarL/FixJ family response regulator